MLYQSTHFAATNPPAVPASSAASTPIKNELSQLTVGGGINSGFRAQFDESRLALLAIFRDEAQQERTLVPVKCAFGLAVQEHQQRGKIEGGIAAAVQCSAE